ncbi:MAG TPA: hypothetical protein VK797_17100 [Tepidisphaeraceae bacterium]|nr:hypothetical protein [Tepidisphaeraceae bacterium]
MRTMRSIGVCLLLAAFAVGCQDQPKPYGIERETFFPSRHREVWAVAPAVNLSGQEVDPLLQADDLYEQLQQVQGLTVVPVNRVAQVFSALQIARVQSPEQAQIVCEQLGCDALIVPTVTIYDPYDPPKFAGALQVFRKGKQELVPNVDVHELSRAATPPPGEPLPPPQLAGFKQSVGMFDAANGTVLERLNNYAAGRNDPNGPLGQREYLLNMDRYCGFVYHELIHDLLRSINN